MRIAQFFVFTFRKQQYEFVIVNELERYKSYLDLFDAIFNCNRLIVAKISIKNDVLNLEICNIFSRQVIFDLLAIEFRLLYYIDVSIDKTWFLNIDIDINAKNKKFVLECDWDVDYLWRFSLTIFNSNILVFRIFCLKSTKRE